MIGVLIVDDDPIVREALTAYLERADGVAVTAVAANGEGAITAARDDDVDVVLMDVHMPGINGLAAAKAILERLDAPRVIMLTTFDEDEYLLAALAAGASGFLVKNTPPEALTQAVMLAHAGGRVLTGHASDRLATDLAPPDRPAPPGTSALTEREREVLQALCEAASNAEIAQRLHLSQSTVKAYVSAVMLKLGCTSRLQTVVRAYELGLARPKRRRSDPRRTSVPKSVSD